MRKLLFFVASCLLMTGCDLEDRLIAKAEEKYDESFKEVFGNIDPEHTWSMAENKSVSVDLDEPSRVKIYVKKGNTYRLAADYQNVSGNKELSFDAPMGCEDILVTVNGAPYQNGGSRAVLNENAIVWTEEEDEDDESENKIDNTYHYYTLQQIGVFHKDQNYLPEKENNKTHINLDYILVSDGQPYTFTPTFWNASFDHVYGIFYYVKNNKGKQERKEIDFYQNKGDLERKYQSQGIQHKELQRWNPGEKKWENVTADCSFDGIFKEDGSFTDTYDGTQMTDHIMRSKHFHIQLPEGTMFGFYVKAGGMKFYSDPSLNEKKYGSHSAFGHIVIGDYTYIVVEDSPNGDNDYNDFVFTMAGSQHDHISEEPNSFIYATEDLGGTDDFDFNDVVFSVTYKAGEEKAHVTLMAAGGTLPAQIYFNDTPVGKEVHEEFGVDVKTMVNTNGITYNFIDLGDVNVGEWSHTSYSEKGNGFKVKITKNKGKINEQTYEVGTPGASTGEAPQMLILEHDWFWPVERTKINEAYPNIGDWAGNYKLGTWANTVYLEKVVQRSILNQQPQANQ